jgi:predicted small secreted protein
MKRLGIIAAFLLCIFVVACENNDGPAENFGESVDESVDDVRDAAEEAGDNIEDATD